MAVLAAGEDRWAEFHSGPFQIVTDGSAKTARERLNLLEQLRNALGKLIGKTDPQLVWPIRLVLFKSPKEFGEYSLPESFAMGRDAWLSAWPAEMPLNRQWLRDCVQLILSANTSRMPAGIERGLRDLFSTLQASGTHVTLGTAMPPDERNVDWALLQMLATNPDTAGKLGVFVQNLAQGGDLDGAAHNAFDKPVADLNRQAAAYLAAGHFPTIEVSARALNPNFDFPERPWDHEAAGVTLADLLSVNPARAAQARAAYSGLKSFEAEAGLGLLCAREKKTDEARRFLGESTAGGTKSARAWVELAALETDPAKVRSDLEKAVPLNPRWAEPHVRLSKLGADAAAQVPELKIAAQLEPRNAQLWQTLAETAEAGNQFQEAAKAWSAAERAAATPEQQARIRQARLDVEQKRLDYEAAERRRAAEEKARDLERVRNAAMAQVQQAVENANRQMAANGSTPPPTKVVPWWGNTEQGSKKLNGVLQRVDCEGKAARLIIRDDDGAVTRLVIRDASAIAAQGGNQALGCGVQRANRRIRVEYNAKPDAKLGVAGEVVMLEFP